MVVGENFKIPVAYYLLSGLNAYGAAAITQLVIEKVNETGAKVISLTQDGPRENIKMAEVLGADSKNNKPYFASPINANNKIYTLFDAPHMLKLFRGCLKNHQLYYNGNPMHWHFIERLYEMQEERSFNLGNKLIKMHLNFKNRPMDVRLASQTMSLSVANGIDLCRKDGYEQFDNSETTTEYLRFANNTFDSLNFKPHMKGAGENFRRPINHETANEFFEFFAQAKEYLQRIEIDQVVSKKVRGKTEKIIRRQPVMTSSSRTPFFGTIHNLTALEGLFNDHVLNGPLKELHSFQFSQDHLETFFSSIRIGLGNDALMKFLN